MSSRFGTLDLNILVDLMMFCNSLKIRFFFPPDVPPCHGFISLFPFACFSYQFLMNAFCAAHSTPTSLLLNILSEFSLSLPSFQIKNLSSMLV